MNQHLFPYRFQPMKACQENITINSLDEITYPVYATPKLDGVRMITMGGQAFSRSLKMIPNNNIQDFAFQLPSNLDGEIMINKALFNEIQSKVMTKISLPFPFEYWIFDWFGKPNLSYLQRLQILDSLKLPRGDRRIKIVLPIIIKNADQLRKTYSAVVAEGYEGLILRNDSKYKFGRSTLSEGGMLKMKQFQDAEAKIIGFEEEMHNTNPKSEDNFGYAKRSSHKANQIGKGRLGKLIVEDCVTKIEFRIGSGFPVKLRQEIWQRQKYYLNKIVTYKFQTYGIKEKPRTPIFKGIRQD